MPFTFPNLQDSSLKHVNLQNGKLWALTRRNEIIARADLNKLEGNQPPLIDENIIKRKNIKKMFVNREGMHCILLAEHELFYCNWEDNHIYQINTMAQEETTRPRAFRSVDIYHDAGEQNFFEILLGTQDG